MKQYRYLCIFVILCLFSQIYSNKKNMNTSRNKAKNRDKSKLNTNIKIKAKKLKIKVKQDNSMLSSFNDILNDDESNQKTPVGHYEKVVKRVNKYFWVNGNQPSGLPGSYVVSEDEASGSKVNSFI